MSYNFKETRRSEIFGSEKFQYDKVTDTYKDVTTRRITPAPSYLALAEVDATRQRIYREMVGSLMSKKIELNISGTYFIGNPDWVIQKYRELRTALSSHQDKGNISPPV